MKTKTFEQIIDRLNDKGVDSIKIMRSDSSIGCIIPGDIIAIEVSKNGMVYIASVSHVFDSPTIDVDRIIRKDGRCISRFTIGQFIYSK